jgi:hypothetical protein
VIPPELQPAYAALVEKAHAPVFFEKLAAHGIVATTQQEQEALLELAGYLQNEKAASASRPGPYAAALAELKNTLGQNPAVSEAHKSVMAKQAATHLAKDADLVEAAAAWGAYTAGLVS